MSNRRKTRREKTERGLNRLLGEVKQVTAPSEEKELLKTVPAVITDDQGVKHTIGTAHLYDDGTVDYIVDKDAPEWAKEKIGIAEKEYEAFMSGQVGNLGPLFNDTKEN